VKKGNNSSVGLCGQRARLKECSRVGQCECHTVHLFSEREHQTERSACHGRESYKASFSASVKHMQGQRASPYTCASGARSVSKQNYRSACSSEKKGRGRMERKRWMQRKQQKDEVGDEEAAKCRRRGKIKVTSGMFNTTQSTDQSASARPKTRKCIVRCASISTPTTNQKQAKAKAKRKYARVRSFLNPHQCRSSASPIDKNSLALPHEYILQH
jgi:hypothetical protein